MKPVADYKKILDNLTGYRFDWNKESKGIVPDDCRESTEIGLIAQDVKEVLPEAVHKWEDNGYLTIKYDKLVPVLVEALKSEMKKTEELEDRLQRLERIIEDKY